MSAANVVDSSGWLEYFADSERAALFAPAIEAEENLVVPVVCIYEVFKKVFVSVERMTLCKSPA